ncbi:MAG TPA: FtsX-like permease family protein [candidate division Zixibacteria bacterium]|nr:FtsX-like permease family protein [candidate division Zixibacteria bacterium]
MKIMTKKIFREMWFNKFRSLSIVIIVAVSLALLSGIRASYPMIMSTYNLNRDTYNVADGRFTFMQPIDEENVSIIQNNPSLKSDFGIEEIMGRILFHTEILYNEEKFQAVIIGLEYPNDINQLVIERKSSDISEIINILDTNDSCLIETRFAGKLLGQDINPDEKIAIDFAGISANFTINGIAQDTDYLYVVDENTMMPLLGELAIVWINLHTAQDYLFSGLPFINQMLFTIDDRFNKDKILDTADDLSYFFSDNNIDVNTLKFQIFDETPDYFMFDSDAGAVDSMGTIFGIIGLIICSVIIFNTINKLVNSQRKNIGLFFAMGSRRRNILFHYIMITLILSFIGVIIGIPMGYALSWGMTKMVTKIYSIHQFAFYLPPTEFLVGSAITLGICLVTSLVSAWPITTVTPRDAMTATFTRIKATGRTFAEKLFGWIPIFQPIHMMVPLREVFMKKKKSLITIFALTTSMVFLVDSLAMEYNMYDVLNKNFTEFNTYDVQINLEIPVPIEQIEQFMINNSIPQVEEIEHTEIFIDIYTKLIFENHFVGWSQLVCYQENSTLRSYNIIKGKIEKKSDLTQNKVLLGNAIASKNNISLNDEINIGILGNYSVIVSGLVGELVDYSVMWTFESFQQSNISDYFGIPKGWVNGIAITLSEEADKAELRESFENYFAISRWVESEIAYKSTMALMEAMMGIMMIFLLVGIFIGVVFSFQSMYIAFVDRQQDFLAFKAMGTKMKFITKMIFWENAILSVFSIVVTIPLGYLFYFWTLDYMLEDKFFVPLSIPWFTWPIVLILSFLSLWLATARLSRRIKKIKLEDELRQTGAT